MEQNSKGAAPVSAAQLDTSVASLVSVIAPHGAQLSVAVLAYGCAARGVCAAFAAVPAVSHVYAVGCTDDISGIDAVSHVTEAIESFVARGTRIDVAYVIPTSNYAQHLRTVIDVVRPRVAVAGGGYTDQQSRMHVVTCVGDAQATFPCGLWVIRTDGINLAPRGITGNHVAVVWATDGNDHEYMRYSVGSMRAEIKTPCDFIVLAEPNVDLHDIDRIHGVTRIDPSPYLAALGISKAEYDKHKGCPYPTLYRLAIPLISRFCCYTHTLYVDSDTMAVRGSLRSVDELFSYPLGDHEVAGVPDLYLSPENTATNIKNAVPSHLRDELEARVWGRFGNAVKTPINAGVVLWNTQRIDRLWYIRRCREFCNMLGRLSFADQGFINCMMGVDNSLPTVFNSAYVGGGPYALGKACIRHYTGSAKQSLVNAGLHDPDLVQDARFAQLVCQPRATSPKFDKGGRRCIVWCCSGGAIEVRNIEYAVTHAKAFCAEQALDIDCVVLCDGAEASHAAAKIPAKLVDISKLVDATGFRNRGRSNWRGGWIFWDTSLLNRLLIPFVPELQGYASVLYMCPGLYPCDKQFLSIFDFDLTGYDCAMAGDFTNVYGVYTAHSAVRFCRWFVGEESDSPDTCAILSRLNAGVYFNTGMFLANMAELRHTFVDVAHLRDLVVLLQDKGAPQVDHDLFNCYCRVLRVSGAYNATGNTHYPHDPVYCVYDPSSGAQYPQLTRANFI